MTRPKLGKNFKKMVPLYEYFARDWQHGLDFSEDALYTMYQNESWGVGVIGLLNGYHHGKKWLNVSVAMWKEDMFRTIWPRDLYEDENLPHWWLDSIFSEHAKEWRTIGLIQPEIPLLRGALTA